MDRNIFLIEKKSKLKKHRPSLALARFSTIFKEQQDKVYHIILGQDKFPNVAPDKVYVSIVFSWDIPEFIKCINKLRFLYPSLKDSDIQIGGVATYHMKDYIIKGTGITPFVGCSKELDCVIPDPSFYTTDETFVFTMRHCPNNCSYCLVPQLEPEYYPIENWKDQINMQAKTVVICDNNILKADPKHKKDVLEYLAQIASAEGTVIEGSRGKIREVEFDGGVDWRALTDENIQLLKKIRFRKFRVAFDNVNYEKGFTAAMERLLKEYPNVSKSRGLRENFEAFVLYNCPDTKDTIEDTLYRAYVLFYKFKIYPYLMRFQPYDTLEYKSYVSPYWSDKDCVDIGRWGNNRRVFMKMPRYKYYYGRKEDGQCINSFNDSARQILNSLYAENLKIDFSKPFKENINVIKEELEERAEILDRLNKRLA